MSAMRYPILEKVERARVTTGRFASEPSFGNNGLFYFKYKNRKIKVIASDGAGWDHVSVSLKHRCPTWHEMCWIKDLFFEKEETVIQFHPAESEYKNFHEFTLHLWRNQNEQIQLPYLWMV